MSHSDSVATTSADEHFCHQYCAFINSQPNRQPHEDLAEAFLEENPMPTGVDYPRDWAIKEDELNKASQRFFNLNRELLPVQRPVGHKRRRVNSDTCQQNAYKGLRSGLYYIAMGFVASMVASYLGVRAAPSPSITEIGGSMSGDSLILRDLYFDNVPGERFDSFDIDKGDDAIDNILAAVGLNKKVRSLPDEEMHYRGEHYDDITGQYFDLYVIDDAVDETTALEIYSNGSDSTLTKRGDWYKCEFPRHNYIQKFCCNTAHGIHSFVSGTGQTVAGISLQQLLQKAFDGTRDLFKPRSICLIRDKHHLCVSWANYDTKKVGKAEAEDMVKHSLECARSGGSTEFKTVSPDGGFIFICVSNHADGCHAHNLPAHPI